MPIYTVTTPMGRLNQDQKEKLAVGITNIHGEETGAPEPLIHVVFMAYPPDSAWSSCKPGHPNVVNASIRAGRSEEVRQRMMNRMSDLMCEVMKIPARDVIVALFDFPPHWGMEAGLMLPATNKEEEDAWNAEFYRRFPEDQYA